MFQTHWNHFLYINRFKSLNIRTSDNASHKVKSIKSSNLVTSPKSFVMIICELFVIGGDFDTTKATTNSSGLIISQKSPQFGLWCWYTTIYIAYTDIYISCFDSSCFWNSMNVYELVCIFYCRTIVTHWATTVYQPVKEKHIYNIYETIELRVVEEKEKWHKRKQNNKYLCKIHNEKLSFRGCWYSLMYRMNAR